MSQNAEKILSSGTPLHEYGVNEYAFSRHAALLAVEELCLAAIPILGGDVYAVVDGRASPNYDSWYCDRAKDESENEYVCRSTALACEYITNYPNGGVLFVIVAK